MNMSFVRISRFYSGFVKQFQDSAVSMERLSYDELYSKIAGQAFGWSDYLGRNLQKHHGVPSLELFSNVPSLQNAWAKEAGFQGKNHEILIERVKRFKPTVVFIQDYPLSMETGLCQKLRDEVPSIRFMISWCCAPFNRAELEHFKEFDLLLTCNPILRDQFLKEGIASEVMHHAFEASLLPEIQRAASNTCGPKRSTVMFAGSLVQGKGFHEGRIEFLAGLAEAGVPLSVYAERPSLKKQIAKKVLGNIARHVKGGPYPPRLKEPAIISRAAEWQNIKVFNQSFYRLRRDWHPPVFGIEMLKTMACSDININFHIDSAGDCAGNARLFEATGVGSCLVTDRKKNLHELFVPDQEVVTYGSLEECIEKIKWLIENPKQRQAIAAAGQKRCLKDHTFAARASRLLEIVDAQRLNA